MSALNEDLDLISVPYAAHVIRESFLKSAAAGRMGVPTVPLTELYSAAGDTIRSRGGDVQFRAGVESFRAQPSDVTVAADGQERKFDYLRAGRLVRCAPANSARISDDRVRCPNC